MMKSSATSMMRTHVRPSTASTANGSATSIAAISITPTARAAGWRRAASRLVIGGAAMMNDE
jgi:hypothetical protein